MSDEAKAGRPGTKGISSGVRAGLRASLHPAAASLVSVLAVTAASAQDAGGDVVSIDPIRVEADQGGYQATQQSITRLQTPLKDTPQTVNVVPQQVIQEQRAVSMEDALRSVPGITFSAGEGGQQGDSPIIRGFAARGDAPPRFFAMWLIVLLFAASTCLGAYHVAVEQHWIAGPTACTGGIGGASSPDQLLKMLQARQPVQCDVVQWSIFGISLAGLNLIASIVLTVFGFIMARRGDAA